MEVAGEDPEDSPSAASAQPQARARRRRRISLVVGLVVVVPVAYFVALVWMDQLEFRYDGPDDAVAAGEVVTIRDPADGACGPLIVSIWAPSVLGQWNRTHNGSAVYDSFPRDEHPWWKVWGSSIYASPVPCSTGGEMTFTLPDDVAPGRVAVCDSSRWCAEVQVR